MLIARINLLLTFIEYYKNTWNVEPSIDLLKNISTIISWNFFQMDGIKENVPFMDNKSVKQMSLFDDFDNLEEMIVSCKIKDYINKKIILFNSIKESSDMKKFDFVIGNPPYQDGNNQIYVYFFNSSKTITKNSMLIFPTGWREPKNVNCLSLLNNKITKYDKQIVYIYDLIDAFPGINGAKFTNIVYWKKGFDNQLNGKQIIKSDDANDIIESLKSRVENEDISIDPVLEWLIYDNEVDGITTKFESVFAKTYVNDMYDERDSAED